MGKNNPKSNLEILRHQLNMTQAEIATELNCDIKTYREYEKGKQVPRSDILIEMYNYFKGKGIPVTTDYILGLSDWRTPETDFIGKHTGLCDNAIHNLHADTYSILQFGHSSIHLTDAINFLLCDRDGSRVLTSIYHYLFGNYTKTDIGSSTITLLDDTDIKCNGAEIHITDINSIFTSNIVEILAQIKAAYKDDTNAKHFGKYNPDTAPDAGKFIADIPPFAE